MASFEPQAPVPPYVAFRTLINLFDWLEQQGMPQRFDRSLWGQRLSGTYGAQVMATLRFLGLIAHDDSPTDQLERLVFNRGQRKTILREILRVRYPTIFQIDLAKATPAQLDEALRALGLQGDTLRKARTFFVHAAQYCEIPLSPYISRRTKGKVASKRAARVETGEMVQPLSVPLQDMHPVLLALLGELNREGHSWTAGQRERWLAAFTAAVDMLFPAVAEE